MGICIISGTNRPGNLSVHVARYCLQLLQADGATGELLCLEDLPREIGSPELYRSGSVEFEPFQDMVDRSRDFVFVVPEYNGSIPGILKLFIDACRYPDSFRGKRAALIGIAAGKGGNIYGLRHLREILEFLGTEVLSAHVHLGNIQKKLGPDGSVTDEAVQQQLKTQISAFRDFAYLN